MPDAATPHLLILNAAEGLLQFAIAKEEQDPGPGVSVHAGNVTLLAFQAWHAPAQGAELLAPALHAAFARLRITPAHITRIACVRGPGSFTGLRLTLATAAGFGRAAGALLAGLDYLPLLAANAAAHINSELFPRPEGSSPQAFFWVLTHARRQLVHMQKFVAGKEGEPRPLTDILICSPTDAARVILAAHDSRAAFAPSMLLGSGLTRHREIFTSAFRTSATAQTPPPACLSPLFDHPTPESLLKAAAAQAYATADIVPLYVRHADAEENLERIALSLGLDPVRARAKFSRLLPL